MTLRQSSPAQVLWHTDPSLGYPDDDYAAAVQKAFGEEGAAELVGALVNRRPLAPRAKQFGPTLAALGLRHHGQPVPVGLGAGEIGRAMGAVHPGAPLGWAPAPIKERRLHLEALRAAENRSLTLLMTTAFTDLDRLLAEDAELAELARHKLRAVVAMSDARLAGERAPSRAVWEPGDAGNNAVDLDAARRVYARLQAPAWQHVTFTALSGWAVLDGGEVSPAFLDELAEASPVARWLRDRAAASMNQRWTAYNGSRVAGRNRRSFVANHLDGEDPGLGPEEPVFARLTRIPLYAVVAAIAAVEGHWFDPDVDERAPNVRVIGVDRRHSGVRDRRRLNSRLRSLLRQSFGA